MGVKHSFLYQETVSQLPYIKTIVFFLGYGWFVLHNSSMGMLIFNL